MSVCVCVCVCVCDFDSPAHHIQHRGLAHRRGLSLGERDGCVSRHEEMTARGGNQRGHETDEVIVHVAGVTQRGG